MPNKLLGFRTRLEKVAARKKGRIDGYFGHVQKGRPVKLDSTLPMNKPKTFFKTSKKAAVNPTYHNWNLPENFPALREAVVYEIKRKEDHDDVTGINPTKPPSHMPPRTTLQRHVERFQALAKQHDVAINAVTREMVFPKLRGGGKALLSDSEREALISAIKYRDESNNGMSRNEAISLVMELSQCATRKQAENHYDFLIRAGKLIGLKNSGRAIVAQSTTTKRSQIVVEQQLRWHTTVEDALEELRRLNQPSEEFELLQDHFFGNVDETCLMAGADGQIKVIASAAKRKTEKITDDSRSTVASMRIGMASGTQGPFTFLAKGTRMDRPSVKNLLRTRCPSGSQVIMAPSACMTDEAYIKLVPAFCKGIRDMEVMRDHPDWWVVLSLDGFGSHVNCHEAQAACESHKILIIKEEGDSSQVNQAYDQIVAKQDKTHMRHGMELVRRPLAKKIDQWHLISLAIEAQLKVTHNDWIKSHKRVNTQPSTRLPFDQFIKVLDDRGVLLSGEKFFEKRSSLMDAMPACWIKLTVEQRHQVLSIIKSIFANATPNEPVVWKKEDVVRLASFVKLEDVYKLRACYLVAQKDPSVIALVAEPTEEVEGTDDSSKKIQDFFSWQPSKLMDPCKSDKANVEYQKKLFDHMSNYCAQMHWNETYSLQPSAALDVELSDDQKNLLNPSHKNVLTGFILYDVKGKGAQKKLAKRRLDMISGNVSSYSRCLNDSKRLKQIQDVNQLVATVAEVTADMDQEKKRQKDEAAQKLKVKRSKKTADDAKEAAKRAEALPGLQAIMDEFVEGKKDRTEFGNLTASVLTNLLKYYYTKDKPKGLAKMSKQDKVNEVLKRFDAAGVEPL